MNHTATYPPKSSRPYMGGYSGEDLYKRIMKGGTTPNSTVNEKYGIK